MANDLPLPCLVVNALNLIEIAARELETFPIHVFVLWLPAERRFLSQRATTNAIDDPLQHAHILSESRPEKLSVGVLAKPIDEKDPRRLAERALHLDPMAEVVAHVIAAEGKHGHRIASDLSQTARRRRGHL